MWCPEPVLAMNKGCRSNFIATMLIASSARTTGGTSRDPTENPRETLRNRTGTLDTPRDAQPQVALEVFPSLALRALSKFLKCGSTGADSHLPMASIRLKHAKKRPAHL
ncbi:hypothetical protein JTB14_023209 [Gonioctena quinquepunctata]|nr:hypothetical protein JTB14_023209 [Gonioctena quinquepunctata]